MRIRKTEQRVKFGLKKYFSKTFHFALVVVLEMKKKKKQKPSFIYLINAFSFSLFFIIISNPKKIGRMGG